MTIFISIKSTKFWQFTLRIKRFIHKRKAVPFFCLTVYITVLISKCCRLLCQYRNVNPLSTTARSSAYSALTKRQALAYRTDLLVSEQERETER